MGFTGLDRVSVGSTAFRLGSTWFHRVGRVLYGFVWVLMGLHGFYWVLPSFTVFFPDFTGFYLVLMGFTVLLGFT